MGLVKCADFNWGPAYENIELLLTQNPADGSQWTITHDVTLPNSYALIYFCGISSGIHYALPESGSVVSGVPAGSYEVQIIITDVYQEVVDISNIVKVTLTSGTGGSVPPTPPFYNPTDPASYGDSGGQVDTQATKQVNQETEAPTALLLEVFKDLEADPVSSAYYIPGYEFVPMRIAACGQAKSLQLRVSSSSLISPVDLSRIEVTLRQEERAGQ